MQGIHADLEAYNIYCLQRKVEPNWLKFTSQYNLNSVKSYLKSGKCPLLLRQYFRWRLKDLAFYQERMKIIYNFTIKSERGESTFSKIFFSQKTAVKCVKEFIIVRRLQRKNPASFKNKLNHMRKRKISSDLGLLGFFKNQRTPISFTFKRSRKFSCDE